MVHHYFMQSPFFDLTSNNAALRTQAQFNPALIYLLQSREAFESRLRTIQGLEFIVVGEPKDVNGSSTSVWNIRKQYRRKAPGSEDELSVLGTYFIVGENVYQAPCLEDVLTSRLVCLISFFCYFNLPECPTSSPSHGQIPIADLRV